MSRQILRRALVMGVLALAMTCPIARAQEACDSDVVEFEGATGRSTITNGVETFELTSAILLQCVTELIAARGTRESENQYRFEGDVRIVERGDTVYADNVLYFSDTKIGHATGHVRITDGRVRLTAPEAVYFTEERRTVFNKGVLYEDSTTVLLSVFGTYRSEDAVAEFSSNVRLWQSSLYLEADEITYWRDLEVTRATGHVFVERVEPDVSWSAVPEDGATARKPAFPDTNRVVSPYSDIISMFGDVVYHDARLDSTRISGSVDMLQIERDSTGRADSLFVRSELISILSFGGRDRVIAAGSVEVIQGRLSVVGDSLVHDRHDISSGEVVTTRMFGEPIAWLNMTQITADSLWLNGVDGSIDSLRATGNVFVAEYDSTLNRIQQLKGRTLLGLFERDSLRTMTVGPNAEALYYVEAEREHEPAAVRSSADRIVFTFEAGSVVDVGSYSGVEGTFFPSNLIHQVENLEGFDWMPGLRPTLVEYRIRWAERMARHPSRLLR